MKEEKKWTMEDMPRLRSDYGLMHLCTRNNVARTRTGTLTNENDHRENGHHRGGDWVGEELGSARVCARYW